MESIETARGDRSALRGLAFVIGLFIVVCAIIVFTTALMINGGI